ncbi:exodeoxyribonuclease III [Candidatus Peregrinibacteria bacterium]|nr:exodeoxyribonuclease III [Candidatus Peregrinibacteria bacterium]
MKIISWNINGLRAIYRKGFLNFIEEEKPDILALQEIKVQDHQLNGDHKVPSSYQTILNSAERKGYSGTALYTKIVPKGTRFGLGIEKFDTEGRTIEADFGDFILFNIYFPNGKMNKERLKFKLDFYDAALKRFDDLTKQGKNLIITGDYNTAHKAIDLARPKANEMISGFLPEERAWMDELVSHGYADCFRHFRKEPENYTWWSMRSRARERNVGWRIDYFFCSKGLIQKLKNCYHLPQVMGSDHCPIVLELKP